MGKTGSAEAKAKQRFKQKLVRVHRWVSLAFVALWLLQALSGAYLAFGRLIDDAALGASGRPASPAMIDRAIASVPQSEGRVAQFFVSGGAEGQVDLLLKTQGGTYTLRRIDGASGAVLRDSALDAPLSGMAVTRAVFLFHKQLLGGAVGGWFIAFSGLLLFGNLLLGLKLGWPLRNRWRELLLPRKAASATAETYAWHRALGFWIAPLLAVMAVTGIALEFTPALERATESEQVMPPACLGPGADTPVAPASAMAAAARAFPGSHFSMVTLPGAKARCYVVQLRQPGELREAFGTSRAFIDGESGAVVARDDALAASVGAQAVAALYAIHSGEVGGAATQALVLLAGLGLAALIGFGVTLWWRRRARR